MKKFFQWLFNIRPKITITELRNMFPMKVVVDQETIDKADIGQIYHCIGALTLQKIFGKYRNFVGAHWGASRGNMYFDDDETSLDIRSNTDMMTISEPQEVILSIYDYNSPDAFYQDKEEFEDGREFADDYIA